jgi:hypothetical protein
MTGNGNNITYKNGDLGDVLLLCFNHMIRDWMCTGMYIWRETLWDAGFVEFITAQL